MKRCLLINDTSFESHLGCQTVSNEISQCLSILGVQVISVVPVFANWTNVPVDVWKKLNLDLVVLNGEGTIHHTKTNLRALRLLQSALFFREKFSIPTYIINATLYDIDNDHLHYLGYFTKIWTRESHSMKRYFDYADIGLMGDLTISSLYNSVSCVSTDTSPLKTLCLSDNHTLNNYESRLKDQIAELFDNVNYFNLSKESYGTPLYRILARKFNKLFGTYFCEIYPNSLTNFSLYTEYAKLIKSNFYVTGRFHGLTSAIVFGVPFLAFSSNTPKNQFLLLDALGSDERLINERVISDTSLKLLIEQNILFTTSERDCLSSYVDRVVYLNKKVFAEIAE